MKQCYHPSVVSEFDCEKDDIDNECKYKKKGDWKSCKYGKRCGKRLSSKLEKIMKLLGDVV
jgi:SNF2 family DNA or RNA helicase